MAFPQKLCRMHPALVLRGGVMDDAEAPVLVVCTCDLHAYIELPSGEDSYAFPTKECGRTEILRLWYENAISSEQADALYMCIAVSVLPERFASLQEQAVQVQKALSFHHEEMKRLHGSAKEMGRRIRDIVGTDISVPQGRLQ